MDIARDQITAGILAGGAGSRLGGVDKGWYELDGQPLIEHTLARLQGQAGTVLISANRELARYRALGWPVVTDAPSTSEVPGRAYDGPLAGVAGLLEYAQTPFVLLAPVDTPRLPRELAARLVVAMNRRDAACVARVCGRVQPLHALVRREALAALESARADGVARVTDWYARVATRYVDWPDAAAFANINAPEDAEALLGRG